MTRAAQGNTRDCYERPLSDWTCGRAIEGCPCAQGPDAKGKCNVQSVCTPRLDGEQWTCTRSTIQGGACKDGPLPNGSCCQSWQPCQPVRTVRSRRKRFVLACGVLALGILMIAVSGPKRNEFLSPGDLTSPHASLMTRDGCASCHAASKHRFGGWVANWLGLAKLDHHHGIDAENWSQTDMCLECHQEKFDPHWARSAHNVDPAWLRERTEQSATTGNGLPGVFERSPHHLTDITCATCHQEHLGASHQLATMTNKQCQTCHAESFKSLASGHPDFGAWPFERRTRIAFDHASHEQLHFNSKNETFNCNRCHVDSADLAVKELAGFEQACASCHSDSIKQSMSQGIALVSLPAIDRASLEAQGASIGIWPTEFEGYFDGAIPPLMQLLLSADPDAVEAMEVLGPDVDLSLIDEEDAIQLEAATRLVFAIKRLVIDMGEDGNATIVNRLSIALQRELTESEIESLLGRTPPTLFASVARTWFGSEAEESGEARGLPAKSPNSNARTLPIRGPQDTRNSRVNRVEEASLQIRSEASSNPHRMSSTSNRFQDDRQNPSQWLAENPLKDFGQSSNGGTDDLLPNATDRSEVDEGNSERGDSNQGGIVERNPIESEQSTGQGTQETEPLVANPLVDAVPNGTAPNGTAPNGTAPSIDDGHGRDKGGRGSDPNYDLPALLNRKPPVYAFTPSGEWDYDADLLKLEYQPKGHADAWLVEWIDVLAATPISNRTATATRVLEYFTGDEAPGRCTECHSLEQSRLAVGAELDQAETWLVNWHAETRSSQLREFTRFSHRPHLILAELSDCRACHQIDREADYRKNYEAKNPHSFRPGFYSLSKTNCASCHQENRASDSCTTCHHYHVQSH